MNQNETGVQPGKEVSRMKSVGTLQKINTVLMTVLGFLLVTLYTKMDTAIKKIDEVHDWKTAQSISIIYREDLIQEHEEKIKELEIFKYKTESDVIALRNYMNQNFVKK